MEPRHNESDITGILIPYLKDGQSHAEFIAVDSFRDTAPGSRLRANRLMKGLGIGQLAAKSGVDAKMIKTAENRPWDVPIRVILTLCESLEIEVSDLTEDAIVRFDGD